MMHPIAQYVLATWLLIIEAGYASYGFFGGQYWDAAARTAAALFFAYFLIREIVRD